MWQHDDLGHAGNDCATTNGGLAIEKVLRQTEVPQQARSMHSAGWTRAGTRRFQRECRWPNTLIEWMWGDAGTS